jgi:hypothetical protein
VIPLPQNSVHSIFEHTAAYGMVQFLDAQIFLSAILTFKMHNFSQKIYIFAPIPAENKRFSALFPE